MIEKPIQTRELIDNLYKKGLMVSLCGRSESDGFHPEDIRITTVNDKYLTMTDWRKIENIVSLVIEMSDINPINERLPYNPDKQNFEFTI